MRLNRLKIQGFRCLYCENAGDGQESSSEGFDGLPGVEITFESLSVLIGPNNAGKSSVLDALEILLGSKRPDQDDFYRPVGTSVDSQGADNSRPVAEIMLCAEFAVDREADLSALPYTLDDTLTLRLVCSPNGSQQYWLGESPVDSRLDQDFEKLNAAAQKQLIQELDPDAVSGLSNAEQRVAWLKEKTVTSPSVVGWKTPPRGFSSCLPRFERYNAIDYAAPENLVLKTLRQVYEGAIYETQDGDPGAERRLVEPLVQIREQVDGAIHSKVSELIEHIRRYIPAVNHVSFDPVLDFTGALRTGQFQIDDGRGLTYLSKLGDGTKRRVLMAVMDWDREVTLLQSADGRLPSVIRGYDEPDTSLDYQSQRRMYQSIDDIVHRPNSRTQAMICTHSPRLVDRAPAQCIRVLRPTGGCSAVDMLHTDNDEGIEQFLSQMARDLGISNTMMFYERCFILVEGATELNALPLLYRTLHRKSLIEDGICVVNVESNGAVSEFLKLLSRNRLGCTLVLLDRDSHTSPAGRKLSPDALRNSAFGKEFLQSSLFYVPDLAAETIGDEFEAAFTDADIASCLQDGWPKSQSGWTSEDISELRSRPGKFSDGIKSLAWQSSSPIDGYWTKPIFGRRLGQKCCAESVPSEVQRLFHRARQIAECSG